jgi:O-antigen/teichoic acid export membrane protein
MPTRSRRFLVGLTTGYCSIGANIVFTMVSIPLALSFLDKEHFALWALAAQINGFLNLIDLGMSSAASRFIADHKDHVDDGEYGSHLLTSGLVFAVQGLLIAGIGIGFSWFAPALFEIPAALTADFRLVLMLLAGITGLSVALRALGTPLWAFQRFDVLNLCASTGQFVTLALLWFGFKSGWGVVSFAIAQFPSLLGSVAAYTWCCRRNHYYPSAGCWGKPDARIFKEIFRYGRDGIMITIGSQLINASQIMIITRWIGLDAATTFSVATKFQTMAMQLVFTPISASAPGLVELHVRGENERFVRRYWDLIAMTLAVSTLVAICLAAGNRSMVTLWTHGAIQWTWASDMLLGLLIVLRNINGCFVGLFGLIKDWRPVRYIYLAEGLLFVPLAIILAKVAGLEGVLVASLIAHLLMTSAMSARAARRIIGPWSRIAKPLAVSLGLIAIASVLGWAGAHTAASPLLVLAATACVAAASLAAIWHWILPGEMRREIGRGLTTASATLRRIFT